MRNLISAKNRFVSRGFSFGILSLQVVGLFSILESARAADVLTVSVAESAPPSSAGFNMGTATRPDGSSITLDTHSLRLNGQPWTPVMGEFHFSRYPQNEWREELLKMKAGGVDIVATYVFWIHHEEVEGQWNWAGDRDLRKFVQLCGEAGLKAIIRCGPWCHGEVRNGGHPDWLLKKSWKLRSDDSNYLAKAEILYSQIAKQLSGLLWKDGGPVIGVQFENEYRGPASHLLTLKKLGQSAGLDVPLYTRTGWPQLSSAMPFGEIAPLYGVYAEGFWDRELKPMPGKYWAGFHFSTLRTDANIANEVLGRSNTKDADDVAKYPYLTCEIGGGMMSSYHRRILVDPADIDSTTLVKLGSGSTSPGYYMYHGGVNPEGLTTLNESQANGEWNDLPVKNYDFQAPLGQYGQINPQYHALRRLHLFLHEWGAQLAGMSVRLPDRRPAGEKDFATLRWAIRSDGNDGFLFVNNFQRLQSLPAKDGVQFKLTLGGRRDIPSASLNAGVQDTPFASNTVSPRTLVIPGKPFTVPPGARFIWPFNLHMDCEIELAYATAQPVCRVIAENGMRFWFFAATPGVTPEFCFWSDFLDVNAASGKIQRANHQTLISGLQTGRAAAIQIKQQAGPPAQIVLLDEADSLSLWKAEWQGRSRVFLTEAGLVLDSDALRLTSPDSARLTVAVLPPPDRVVANGRELSSKPDGVFARFAPEATLAKASTPSFELVRSAGPAREVPLSQSAKPVAAQPVDTDFTNAAIWRITLPAQLDLATDPLLRLRYVGDVARVTLNGKLINDDFYNGEPLDIGLRRYAPEILKGELCVAILPLRKDAPIFLPPTARPDFDTAGVAVGLKSAQIVPRHQVELRASK